MSKAERTRRALPTAISALQIPPSPPSDTTTTTTTTTTNTANSSPPSSSFPPSPTPSFAHRFVSSLGSFERSAITHAGDRGDRDRGDREKGVGDRGGDREKGVGGVGGQARSLRRRHSMESYSSTHSMMSQTFTYQSRLDFAYEIKMIKEALEEIQTELDVLKICYNQLVEEQNFRVVESPDRQILEKMIKAPYTVLSDTVVNLGSIPESGPEQESDLLKTTMSLALKRTISMSMLLPQYNLNAVSSEHLSLLSTTDFDVLSLVNDYPNEYEREHYTWLLIMHMYHSLGLVEAFKISERTLYRFTATICRKYRHVPFHNWYHAFNVTQTMFFLLVTCKCRKLLGPLELLALFTAAVCHDADHPGLNNIFHVKAHTRVAFIHKASTLENHHHLQALSVLYEPHCRFVKSLTENQTATFFDYLGHIILATDLSLHKIILKSMEDNHKKLSKAFGKKKPNLTKEESITVCCCIMKCSDLSNEIRPKKIADKWAALINKEFSEQSAAEKALGLPLTPWIDPDKIIMEKEQINFIKGLCLPLYQTLQSVFGPVEVCIAQLQENLANWEERFQQIEITSETRPLTDRSVFLEDQQKGTGKSLVDHLSALASGAAFGLRLKKKDKSGKKDKKK